MASTSWTWRKIAASAALTCAALGIQTGCQNAGQRRAAAREPALSGPLELGPPTAVTEAPAAPPKALTWVDRHPLFFKPRDMYEKTDSNPVVKTAAATVIGIPSGLMGELRQIVVGTSPGLRQ
jgi:hypothetical protein